MNVMFIFVVESTSNLTQKINHPKEIERLDHKEDILDLPVTLLFQKQNFSITSYSLLKCLIG